MIRGPKIELYPNEHLDKVSFMIKSFTTFYLIQYHKNAFHNKLFLSGYSILQMKLYFSGLVKNCSRISALGCLESVAKKSVYLEKKATHKINFQLAKFTF